MTETTNNNTPLADTGAVRRGFAGLVCVKCGEPGCVSICLEDLEDGEALHCGSCEVDYGLDDVRELMAAWGRVLLWIDAAPALEE